MAGNKRKVGAASWVLSSMYEKCYMRYCFPAAIHWGAKARQCIYCIYNEGD